MPTQGSCRHLIYQLPNSLDRQQRPWDLPAPMHGAPAAAPVRGGDAAARRKLKRQPNVRKEKRLKVPS